MFVIEGSFATYSQDIYKTYKRVSWFFTTPTLTPQIYSEQ